MPACLITSVSNMRRVVTLLGTPVNHMGQHFPPGIASALVRASKAAGLKSDIWVTPTVLEAYGQSRDASCTVVPTMVEVGSRPLAFYNAEQVEFYIPKGIGFVYSGATAKELVLAAKLHGFISSYWCTAKMGLQRGFVVKPDQTPILVNNIPFYNADQLDGAETSLAAADARVRSLPAMTFRSLAGKRYNREMCADLAEFLTINKVPNPGQVWGTPKAFQKHNIFIQENACPYQIVSDDGVVYDMYNSSQTTEPQLAEQLGHVND